MREKTHVSEQKGPEALCKRTLMVAGEVNIHAWTSGEAEPLFIDVKTASKLIIGSMKPC